MPAVRNRAYSFQTHGQVDTGGASGNYCFKPGMVSHWSPPYGNGVITFRMFPAVSPENPTELDPYRWNTDDPQEPLGFGDWIRRYPAVRNVGEPGVTYFYEDPSEPLADKRMTPAWVLYNAIKAAIKQKVERPGWASLLEGGAGRSPQWPRPPAASRPERRA